MSYNWQHKSWPKFVYKASLTADAALLLSKQMGEMSGVLQGLTAKKQQDALIRTLMDEALKTSAIEGELLNREDVMSSIKNNLGINAKPEAVKDKKAKAIAALMIEVRNNYDKKLTEALIKQWHAILFVDSKQIKAGKWRSGNEPMQIVSGTVGKEIVHFEAPPSENVSVEMKAFIQWYNDFKTDGNMVQTIIKTAIAHLYFETIHPFEDGNGRIGRAIAEKCFAQSLGHSVMLSLSSVLEKKRKQYYAALKEAQNSLHINNWIAYFAQVMIDAQSEAIKHVQSSLRRTQFFDAHKSVLNSREEKVLKKMFDAGSDGFEGGMTAKKYMSITKASKATATRDLQHLAELGVLEAKGGGRSVYYELGD